jgi:hypothetical protein
MGNSLSHSVDLLIPFIPKFGADKVEVADNPFLGNRGFPRLSWKDLIGLRVRKRCGRTIGFVCRRPWCL